MTIEQIDKVDFISVEKDTGDVKLTISDHLDWNETDHHLILLQKKINTYIRFVESGEIKEVYPEVEGKKILFFIAFEYKPIDACLDFLKKVEIVLSEINIDLFYDIL